MIAHCHSAEEEIFVIVEGAQIVRLGDEEHAVRAGHAISATEEPFSHLAYGIRERNDIVYYPESGEVWLRGVDMRLQTR